MKSNTKVTMPKPTKKEIDQVLNDGLILVEKSKSVTDVITRDLHHADENNETQLTKKFDNIMNTSKDDKIKGEKLQELLEVRKQLKRFVKNQIQTLVKEKPTQLAILEDDHKTMTATLKKVNKPMVENEEGKYVDNFNETDIGKYRLVRMYKEQKADRLEERLLKWMRSEKREGLFNGTKADSKNLEMYDFESLKAVIESIEKNGL
tara:strand:+ start:387 stop:1004 length:618 start_codon:yes stop_codon:yes gene_type:complete